MIRAFIFDLDGTLVQTESLKAISYAGAAVELSPNGLSEEAVIEAFKDVVGLSRQEVGQSLMQRFGLEETVQSYMAKLRVQTPWQAFLQVRLAIYRELLADPKILHDHLCPHSVALLEFARRHSYRTGLATMSHRKQTEAVLSTLNLSGKFDFIAARDDVEKGKPDAEIYLVVAKQLDVLPGECLVIEDSATGVQAALAAQMHCIAVTNDFTRQAIHQSDFLPEQWIVDDLTQLQFVADQILSQNSDG